MVFNFLKKRSFNILIVDDESDLRIVIKDYLPKKYTTFEAGSAESALAFLRESDVKIDLALVDIGLPEMDGFELMDKINKEFPKISYVIITGGEGRERVKQGATCNAADFIHKPFDRDTLNNVVENVLKKKKK